VFVDPKGKFALVTGGASRVGGAITLGLAGAGADVVIHYRSSAGKAEQVAAEARRRGRDALAIQADLSDQGGAEALGEAVEASVGGVDILVHAASPFIETPLKNLTPSTWRLVMGVVVESFLWLAQRFAPYMKRRGEGAIITVLDLGAFQPWPRYLAHGVSKSALWALTRSLAVELAPEVRVNAVVPGPVLPPPDYTEAQIAEIALNTLLGRWGTPQDAVEAVLFLVRSSYVTGEALVVDGGERWAHRRVSEN
jgi:NAD(P)-dependent dehydrogenase (short-subunit alcohol dehydrogenase family)